MNEQIITNEQIIRKLFEVEDKVNAISKWIDKIDVRLQTINDRTKNHTLYIKDLEKKLKKLK